MAVKTVPGSQPPETVAFQSGAPKFLPVQANDDLETAESAAELLKPWSITASRLGDLHWIRVPDNALAVIPRARNDAAMSAVATSPVVRLIGAYGTPNGDGGFSGDPDDPNYGRFVRLDNADFNAAGLSLTLATTGNNEDSDFEHSDLPSLTGYALLGCHYVGMLVETAASITGANAYGDLLFL